VWPDLLNDLKRAGARNYSIYLRGNDLFGYLEVEDLSAFQRSMGESDVNAGWQVEMASLIDPLTDPATGFISGWDEVFHLD
jgi:L-rhamnose mutarotase